MTQAAILKRQIDLMCCRKPELMSCDKRQGVAELIFKVKVEGLERYIDVGRYDRHAYDD